MRTIITLQDARNTFDELAAAKLVIEKANAAFEAKVARLKTEHGERLASQCERLCNLEAQLLGFIEANKGLFKDPRKVKTDFGTFGLQAVTDLFISDEASLISYIQEFGYDDCLKVTRTPVKKTITARMVDSNEPFPGCTVRTGDTAVYSIKKALVDQAKEEASNA